MVNGKAANNANAGFAQRCDADLHQTTLDLAARRLNSIRIFFFSGRRCWDRKNNFILIDVEVPNALHYRKDNEYNAEEDGALIESDLVARKGCYPSKICARRSRPYGDFAEEPSGEEVEVEPDIAEGGGLLEEGLKRVECRSGAN